MRKRQQPLGNDCGLSEHLGGERSPCRRNDDSGRDLPAPLNPGDIRILTFADSDLLFYEVQRHWAKDTLLGQYPLALSNPTPENVTIPRKRPPLPFGNVQINPSQRFGLRLRFTIWHDNDQILREWDTTVRKLFTADPFTFEGYVFNVRRPPHSEKLIPLGARYADENGVVPYILGDQCTLCTTTGMGDREWRPFVVG